MTRLFAGTPFDQPPTCATCGALASACTCSFAEKQAAEAARQRIADRLPPNEQTARVSRQKRPGGRTATVIEGLTARANDLQQLFRQLQSQCGSGGTVKEDQDVVELQGDHVEKVRAALRSLGYRVK
jgi:translation initiation factor 1